jgi:hypothetical protein
MERLRVGLTAVVLLLGGWGQGRADYLFPSRLRDLDGAGPFLSPHGIVVPPSGSVLIAEALNHRIQVFLRTGLFVTRFGNLSTGYEQLFEPGDVAMASLLDPLTWQPSTDGTSFLGSGSFGTLEGPVTYAVVKDTVPFADSFAAASFQGRRQTSPSNDPFLGSIGYTIGEAQSAEPSRIIVEPPGSMLGNRKVVLSLIVLGVSALATVGYLLRQRKPSMSRAPGGRRPISPYRPANLPNPRGTITSPPP